MKTKIRQLPVIPQNPLPPLYAAWIDGILDGPIPNESQATCNNCAMLPDENEGQDDSSYYFNPKTKCCTYMPDLHNFLIGRILLDEDPSFSKGRASVEARINTGFGVTPLGLAQTQMYSLLYRNVTDVFGRSKEMLCPHYIDEEGGRCGIWKHRESVCVTWFCKFESGVTGKIFWANLLGLLSFIEKNISLWCVIQLDVGTDAMQAVLPVFKKAKTENPTTQELNGVSDEKQHRRHWGTWFGRETEFYKECALLANNLTWSDIERICGPELQIHKRLLQDAYQKLVSNEIPERLRVGKFQLTGTKQGGFTALTYSGYDIMSLSQSVIGVLLYFDGRPVTEVLDEIVDKENLRVSPSLLRKLVDFGMLVAV